MDWYFEPRRNDSGPRDDSSARDDEGDSASGLISLPEQVLQRHGALKLDPAQAVAVHGYPSPRSTVYRARSLLIPGYLLQDPGFIEAVNGVLERAGMRLIPPERERGDSGRELRQLPRPAVLVPAEGNASPVTVDAWVALQTLRAAAGRRPADTEKPASTGRRVELDRAVVQQIELEHLLVGSAITGSPAGHVPGAIRAIVGTSTDSYTYANGDTRAPVGIVLNAPGRKPAGVCAADYGRRPVVAVLDTGARVHPWLDVEADPVDRYRTVDDGFVAVDHDIQLAIESGGSYATACGDRHRQVIRHPWDTPVTADPLVGELDTDTGHGTFIAGIVRQVVPDARVLAVRIMHSDGIVNEGDLLCALYQLIKRVTLAQAGDMTGMVDVVSLSLGYFSESAADVAYSSGLRKAIGILLGLGVTVVAAAGNYSTSCRFYPAGFTQSPPPAGRVPLIAVGALNPDGSKALFSDGGHWVTAWAAGAAVVSTFPTDINGSLTPAISLPATSPSATSPSAIRAALDPDDYSGGFAVWSGTSFSAPLIAALVARSLLTGAADQGLRLDLPGPAAATDRALAALQNLGWGG